MTVKAPVEGAVRCYRLAPASEPDAYEYVAGKLRERGWNPVEQDYALLGVNGGQYVDVHLWAIPPNYAALKARRDAARAARQPASAAGGGS